jgi:hypothetical protein
VHRASRPRGYDRGFPYDDLRRIRLDDNGDHHSTIADHHADDHYADDHHDDDGDSGNHGHHHPRSDHSERRSSRARGDRPRL